MEFQFDPKELHCVTAALLTPLESACKFLQTRRITTAFTLASWLQDHSQVKSTHKYTHNYEEIIYLELCVVPTFEDTSKGGVC